MRSRTAVRAGAAAVASLVCFSVLWTARAQTGGPPPATAPAKVRLRYAFQPDCIRKSPEAPCDTPKGARRLDFGPQIAVWLERPDGTLVDTLMVTNATAVWGIGNRPGFWRFPSNWRFPYGKRKMVLPVWAHARGRLYDSLVMQDFDGSNEKEQRLGYHEDISSPDPYYCLTFRPATWVMDASTVDAITCPTGVFNSSKGRFSPTETKSYYPPRNDITTFTPNDCDMMRTMPCPHTSAMEFGQINDLDAVATATPRYGKVYSGVWTVPAELPEGPYALAVEVNKEFDNNAAHSYPAYQDPQLPENGLLDNMGQPSVVFKVPFRLDRKKTQQGAATDMAGYGDWNGDTGTLHPPDSTISTSPGSGVGRFLVVARPAAAGGAPVQGRVHLVTEVPPSPEECAAAPADNGHIDILEVPGEQVTATEAVVNFKEAADRGRAVDQYEIRYRQGDSMTPETFAESTPAPSVTPVEPGAPATVTLVGLKPDTVYTVGIRVRGGCVNEGPLKWAPFTTRKIAFTQLSGCFVATAAYGSALAPQIDVLRQARDRLRRGSAFAAAAVGLYERASPPLASMLRETAAGRALMRAALAPLTSLAADVQQVQDAARR